MIKYFHELRHEEYMWLIQEENTWGEVAVDFPGPAWCKEQGNVVDGLGCWSLIAFQDGHSCVTGEDFCKNCEYYRKGAK
jgi:hypothetical protein